MYQGPSLNEPWMDSVEQRVVSKQMQEPLPQAEQKQVGYSITRKNPSISTRSTI